MAPSWLICAEGLRIFPTGFPLTKPQAIRSTSPCAETWPELRGLLYFTVPTWPAAISRSSTRLRERSSSLVSSGV